MHAVRRIDPAWLRRVVSLWILALAVQPPGWAALEIPGWTAMVYDE